MASIVLGMGLGLYSLSHAQMGGVGGGMGGGVGGGMPTIPGTEFGGATDPSSIRVVEGFHVIPSVGVSERYDSNVYFAPKSLLQGLTPEDFVTTVMPQVRGLYTDHKNLVKVNAAVGAVGSYYANNTALSYVGANAGVVLDMSDLLSQWRPGARWTVSDTFFYSPQPPAFLAGGQSGQQANPLVAGFQAYRTNTTSNSVNTVFELPLNRTLNLSGSYRNSFIHYGASDVPQAPALISQQTQSYTAGLVTQVSLYDSMRADFIGNEYDQGELGAFTTMGPTLGWTHRFSPAISINVVGGAQLLSGQLNGVPLSSKIAPFGSLAVFWNNPATSIALAYHSGITPSFQFEGAAMLNHTVAFNMTQNTPIRDLAALLRANYSIANEYGSNSGGGLSWTTVGGSAGLLYRATQKTFLTLTYDYQNVDNVFAGTHFAFDRNVVQLSLTQAFY
ncbi:MAG: hypothetical protein P0119_06240 [Nitrospira sp.]|nr:hypothetical protein [Nitrospira sp.]